MYAVEMANFLTKDLVEKYVYNVSQQAMKVQYRDTTEVRTLG